MRPDEPRVAVVGADGFVGRLLAQATGGVPLVYGAPGPGEIEVSRGASVLRSTPIVVYAGGFRVRPGLGEEAYRASHAGAVWELSSLLGPGQSLLLISSASVLGRDRTRPLGGRTRPRPDSFPHPVYARAKLEAEDVARGLSRARGFRLLILRPAVLYGGPGDGMVGTLVSLARRGIRLRLVPGRARQHLCSVPLLVAAVRRAVAPDARWPEEALLLADPFVLTNADLNRAALASAARPGRRGVTIPFSPRAAGAILRFVPGSRRPRLDLKTWGGIFRILDLDTEYEAGPSFDALGLDVSLFGRSGTWELVEGGQALTP